MFASDHFNVGIVLNNIILIPINANSFAHMHGRQVVKGHYGMQAVKPVNIAMTKCDKKWKSKGKWIVYATNFKSRKR